MHKTLWVHARRNVVWCALWFGREFVRRSVILCIYSWFRRFCFYLLFLFCYRLSALFCASAAMCCCWNSWLVDQYQYLFVFVLVRCIWCHVVSVDLLHYIWLVIVATCQWLKHYYLDKMLMSPSRMGLVYVLCQCLVHLFICNAFSLLILSSLVAVIVVASQSTDVRCRETKRFRLVSCCLHACFCCWYLPFAWLHAAAIGHDTFHHNVTVGWTNRWVLYFFSQRHKGKCIHTSS